MGRLKVRVEWINTMMEENNVVMKLEWAKCGRRRKKNMLMSKENDRKEVKNGDDDGMIGKKAIVKMIEMTKKVKEISNVNEQENERES